jgi:two-component system chemotaxis response regulator CheV
LLETGTNELEVLEFDLAGESFGINVAKVKELMQYCEVRSLPNAHPCVEGVFQPRDELYTVLDLAKYLGLPASANPQKDIYIITSFNKMKAAFHVHGVESIHRFSWTEVEKPDSIIYGGDEGVVTGIVKIGGKISAILDFEKSPSTSIRRRASNCLRSTSLDSAKNPQPHIDRGGLGPSPENADGVPS